MQCGERCGTVHDVKTHPTVFVGLSGGVDSSVAALRLLAEGYNVVGVFIKVWHPDFLVCNWEQERLDAMRVAAHLRIPFLTCDAVDAYRTAVAEYFIAEYAAGRTPNPDVMCNKAVKFGAFLEFARAHGADFIATGHYVEKGGEAGQYTLLRGTDSNKDQSYFLWTLTQEQLSQALFPVGRSPKDAIREEATAAGIPTATKKDSQGICFLGHIDIPEFLSHFVELKDGDVLDTNGAVIGRHDGALIYTIGQRHGFTITSTTTEQKPQYVVAKNLLANTITVATERQQLTTEEVVTLDTAHWITAAPETGSEITVQFRYRQDPIAATLVATGTGTCTIRVLTAAERPAVGQSCVLYRGNQCLGGGIIAT